MKTLRLVIADVLSLGPINFEGLDIDTSVEVEIHKYGSNYSVEYSTFDVEPIYAQTAFGHSVKLDLAGSQNFKDRLKVAIDEKAILTAKLTPEYKWEDLGEDEADRQDEV